MTRLKQFVESERSGLTLMLTVFTLQNPTESTSVCVHNLLQSHMLAIDLLNVLARTLHPPLISQWLLSDLHCRLAEATVLTLEYFLSPNCSATSTMRAKYLAGILTAAQSSFTSITMQGALGASCTRLLQLRLRDGPLNDWGVVDDTLQELFDTCPGLCSPANVKTVVEVLRMDGWAEDGAALRVLSVVLSRPCNGLTFISLSQKLCYAYLRNSVNGLDDVTLQLTRSVDCTGPLSRDEGSTKLLDDITHCSAAQHPAVTHNDLTVISSDWRHKTWELLREIVFPEEITLPSDRLSAVEMDDLAVKVLSERFSRSILHLSLSTSWFIFFIA